jgi:hypothetical protein
VWRRGDHLARPGEEAGALLTSGASPSVIVIAGSLTGQGSALAGAHVAPGRKFRRSKVCCVIYGGRMAGRAKRKPKAKEAAGNGVVALIKEPWQAAVGLRESIEPADYKRDVLSLMETDGHQRHDPL